MRGLINMYKIGIILFHNIRFAPFLENYLNILKNFDHIEVDVLYVDRLPELNEIKDEHHIAIRWRGFGINRTNKLAKIYNCITYPSKAIKIIEKNEYDFLIVLTTMPAVLLCDFLVKRYPGKYIVDVRDYTKEHVAWYRKKEEKFFSNSALNVISSPGFRSFLPPNDYYVMHNLNLVKGVCVNNFEEVKRRNKIRISYIGSIQYKTQCKKLIDLVAKDPDFEFFFYGNEIGGDEIRKYVDEVNCDRIQMKGTFEASEKERIYNESSLVFNCYGNDSLLLTKAISNKHYDAALYQRPLLVSPDTLMEELAGEFAYAVSFENLKDLESLKKWFYNIDEEKFLEYTRTLIENAVQDNQKVEDLVRRICSRAKDMSK